MQVQFWLENTKSTHDHGGEGWEFGKCLWAPGPGQYGSQRYEFMHEVKVGDRVIHSYDRMIRGVSSVIKKCELTNSRPPNAGPYAGHANFYRINLSGYHEFDKHWEMCEFIKTHSEQILAEINDARPKRYPFCYHCEAIKPVQGQFLTRVTPSLANMMLDFVGAGQLTQIS